RMESTEAMRVIEPACLVKIVSGAVDYAQSFGFPPHPDYRHASMLLDGIDATTCPQQFTFGRDGKPFYVQGPDESTARAAAISQRMHEAGGHFFAVVPGADFRQLPDFEDELSLDDSRDDVDSAEDDERV